MSKERKYEIGHELSNGPIAVDSGVTVDLYTRGQMSPKAYKLINSETAGDR